MDLSAILRGIALAALALLLLGAGYFLLYRRYLNKALSRRGEQHLRLPAPYRVAAVLLAALALGAVLTALALALSYAERFFPLQLLIPLPGVKLGLANLVTVYALYRLGLGQTLAILLLRCTLGAVFGGGVTAWLFSVSGGLAALAVMAALRQAPVVSVYGVSIGGAAAHHLGQLLAARAVLASPYVWAYLPFLLAAGLVTGAVTGAASTLLVHRVPLFGDIKS